MYSDLAIVVVILGENIANWREVKATTYQRLAEIIREGAVWKVFVFTVEVGARGFVAKRSASVWRQLGFKDKRWKEPH